MATKRAISAATPTSDSSVRAEPHPCSGASTTVNTRSRSAAVMLAAPGRSRSATTHGRADIGGDQAQPAREGGRRDDDRHEEDKPPTDLSQHAADDQSQGKAGSARRGVDRQCAVTQRPFGEARRDDRQPCRCGERRSDPLEEPRRDQHRPIVRDASDAGGDEEDGQRDEEHLAATEQIGGSPPSSRKPPKPITYPLTSHCSERVDKPRSAWMEGRATPIIETSSASSKIEAHSTSISPSALPRSRSDVSDRPAERPW